MLKLYFLFLYIFNEYLIADPHVIDRIYIVNCGVMFNNKKKCVWKSFFPLNKKMSKSNIIPKNFLQPSVLS